MTVSHLSRLFSFATCKMAMRRQQSVSSALPGLLKPFVCHLNKTHAFSTLRWDTRTQASTAADIVIRQFSASSVWTFRKNSDKKSGISATDLCELFDQKDMLIGRMTVREAEELAQRDSLKLLNIGENANHMQCFRLLSGKELVEENKRQRLERKNERMKEKEFRISSNITEHDFDIKLRQARNVLVKSGRVKFVIRAHRRPGKGGAEKTMVQILKKATMELKDCAVIKEGVNTQTELQLFFRPLPAATKTDVE